jgi:hypothetical protein
MWDFDGKKAVRRLEAVLDELSKSAPLAALDATAGTADAIRRRF